MIGQKVREIHTAREAFEEVNFPAGQVPEFPLDLLPPNAELNQSRAFVLHCTNEEFNVAQVGANQDYVSVPTYRLDNDQIESWAMKTLEAAATETKLVAENLAVAAAFFSRKYNQPFREIAVLKRPGKHSICVSCREAVVMSVRDWPSNDIGMAVLDAKYVIFMKEQQ